MSSPESARIAVAPVAARERVGVTEQPDTHMASSIWAPRAVHAVEAA